MNPFKVAMYAKTATRLYQNWQRSAEMESLHNEDQPLAGDSSDTQSVSVNDFVQASAVDLGYDPDVKQQESDTCAIHSQYHVLKEYGYNGSVDDLIKEAAGKGWYAPGGTAPEDVGNLLESNGVPCKNVTGATIFDLMNEIAQGKSVIVPVDSGELYNGEDKLTDILENSVGIGADHAIAVRDIHLDIDDFGNSKVICTDSGTGHIAKEYSIGEFMDSWQDGKFRMIVPLDPPPQDMNLDRLAGFDYEAGYFPGLDNVSWQDYYENYINGLDGELAENVFLGGSDTSGMFDDTLADSLLGDDSSDSFMSNASQDYLNPNDFDDQFNEENSDQFNEENYGDTFTDNACDTGFLEEPYLEEFLTPDGMDFGIGTDMPVEDSGDIDAGLFAETEDVGFSDIADECADFVDC